MKYIINGLIKYKNIKQPQHIRRLNLTRYKISVHYDQLVFNSDIQGKVNI